MQMLPNQLKDKLRDGLLSFLWRQWSQLGVAGNVEFRDRWVIDPEALLLFTLNIGRYDPRLFDEVLDWCASNGRWLSVQRLTNIADQLGNDDDRNVLAAFAEFMRIQETSKRWDRLVGESRPSADGMRSLFLDKSGLSLPVLGTAEPMFTSHGLLRSPLHLRGMSRPVRMDMPVSLIFRLRALFGLSSARAEVIAYLDTHAEGYPNEIARAIRYSAPSIQQVLADLAESGFVKVHESGRAKTYVLDRLRWRQFLRLPPGPLRWVDWGRTFIGLSILNRFLMTEPVDRLSDYMLESRLRSLVEEIEPCFVDAGLESKAPAPARFRGSPKEFHVFITRLLRALNPKSEPSRIF